MSEGTLKTDPKRVEEILRRMDETYGTEIPCYLDHETPWQLLFATILSAQCTDARVNQVTKKLFVQYPDLASYANADLKDMEEAIHSTGFYHNKAKNIIACARRLLDDFGGEVPRSLEDLISLPGVGRKTANVIRGNIFHDPSVVVDTHVGRIARRLQLTEQKDPVKVEYELMEVIPKKHWILVNHQFIALGRAQCSSLRPKCEECYLNDLCAGPHTK